MRGLAVKTNYQGDDMVLKSGGEVRYAFRMLASFDQPLRCTTTHPNVLECVFSKSSPADEYDPAWSLVIRFGPVHSLDEIEAMADEIKEDLLDRLSFALNTKADRIRLTGSSAHTYLPMPTLEASGRTGGRPLNTDDVREVQASLAKSYASEKSGTAIELYRSALGTDDPVGKFLILYLILYVMTAHETQPEVDNLIRSVERSTVEMPIPPRPNVRRTGKSETIYTQLRNAITHRAAVKREAVKRGVLDNLDPFQMIVLKVIRASL